MAIVIVVSITDPVDMFIRMCKLYFFSIQMKKIRTKGETSTLQRRHFTHFFFRIKKKQNETANVQCLVR